MVFSKLLCEGEIEGKVFTAGKGEEDLRGKDGGKLGGTARVE